MKRQMVEELLQEFEDMWLNTTEEVASFYAKDTPLNEETRKQLRTWFRRNPRTKFYRDVFRRVPDNKADWLREQLRAFPDAEVRAAIRDWLKSFSAGTRREPLVPAAARRKICEEVRVLQRRMKRPYAIEQVATDHGLKPTQVEGMLKHATRYKDMSPRRRPEFAS